MRFKAAVVTLIALAFSEAVSARMTPSRSSGQSFRTAVAVNVIVERLEKLGLSPSDAKARLAMLSSEDVQQLAQNVEHLQTAGMSRTAKWVVVGIAVVLILAWAIDQAGSPYAW